MSADLKFPPDIQTRMVRRAKPFLSTAVATQSTPELAESLLESLVEHGLHWDADLGVGREDGALTVIVNFVAVVSEDQNEVVVSRVLEIDGRTIGIWWQPGWLTYMPDPVDDPDMGPDPVSWAIDG